VQIKELQVNVKQKLKQGRAQNDATSEIAEKELLQIK
jgi:hypothetical protein